MDWENKTIGFAMCGSRRTMILIQLNDCLFGGKVGAKCKIFTSLGCILGA